MTQLLSKAIELVKLLPDREQDHIANLIIENIQQKSIIKGISGQQLLIFAGIIPSDEIKQISKFISQDCSQVDADEW